MEPETKKQRRFISLWEIISPSNLIDKYLSLHKSHPGDIVVGMFALFGFSMLLLFGLKGLFILGLGLLGFYYYSSPLKVNEWCFKLMGYMREYGKIVMEKLHPLRKHIGISQFGEYIDRFYTYCCRKYREFRRAVRGEALKPKKHEEKHDSDDGKKHDSDDEKKHHSERHHRTKIHYNDHQEKVREAIKRLLRES